MRQGKLARYGKTLSWVVGIGGVMLLLGCIPTPSGDASVDDTPGTPSAEQPAETSPAEPVRKITDPPSGPTPAPVLSGLVAQIALDQFGDEGVGYRDDVRIEGGKLVDGPLGRKALNLGSGAHVAFESPTVPAGPMSLAMWLKIENTHLNNQYVLTNGGSGSRSEGVALFLAGERHVQNHNYPKSGLALYVADRQQQFRAGVFVDFPVGSWHHVVAVWNGYPEVEALQLWVDGEAASPEYFDAPDGPFGPPLPLVIGGAGDGRNVKWPLIDGAVQDFRIYNRPLTREEAKRLAWR